MQENDQELTEENLLIEVMELCEEGALERAFEVIQFVKELGYSDQLIAELERVYSEAYNTQDYEA